ncbi:hypothetical protein [Shewanella baltica]|uniref:hypothetical protein n=1 Tax=Shewanella baltica TaxID=62322 RepID=UPI003D035022
MKLANVDMSEISVQAVYVINCFMCVNTLHLDAGIGAVGDAAVIAASQGWHSYETDNETCSAACPNCIKEVRENLTETTEEPTA